MTIAGWSARGDATVRTHEEKLVQVRSYKINQAFCNRHRCLDLLQCNSLVCKHRAITLIALTTLQLAIIALRWVKCTIAREYLTMSDEGSG